MHTQPTHTYQRRGAALIIAIVLLAVLGIVAGIVVPQIVRDRQKTRLDLLRTQTRQLLDDALRHAERKREGDSEFTGETWTLGPDVQPFSGSFRITTRFENDAFVAEVEYRDEDERIQVQERK